MEKKREEEEERYNLFFNVQSSSSMSQKQLAPAPSADKWQAPPAGWAKLNVDGSFIPGEDTGAAGMVPRDEAGAIIFFSLPLPSLLLFGTGSWTGGLHGRSIFGIEVDGQTPHH